jgi:hypothetical protein
VLRRVVAVISYRETITVSGPELLLPREQVIELVAQRTVEAFRRLLDLYDRHHTDGILIYGVRNEDAAWQVFHLGSGAAVFTAADETEARAEARKRNCRR